MSDSASHAGHKWHKLGEGTSSWPRTSSLGHRWVPLILANVSPNTSHSSHNWKQWQKGEKCVTGAWSHYSFWQSSFRDPLERSGRNGHTWWLFQSTEHGSFVLCPLLKGGWTMEKSGSSWLLPCWLLMILSTSGHEIEAAHFVGQVAHHSLCWELLLRAYLCVWIAKGIGLLTIVYYMHVM